MVRTLCNIQTNVHHPHAPNNSLCYSIKYQLKNEPHVLCEQAHPEDDTVTHYLRAQFVSLARAASAVLGSPITSCTWVSPLAIPSWTVGDGNREWRVYTRRVDVEVQLQDRVGWPSSLHPDALGAALLFAKFQSIARYFSTKDARRDGEASDNSDEDNTAVQPEPSATVSSESLFRASSLSAHSWDSTPDKTNHPFYDPVLSMLLPGDVIRLAPSKYSSEILRRVRNHRFGFGRFDWTDLSFQKNASGRTNRSRNFQTRLQAYLPWVCVTPASAEVLVNDRPVLLTPVPKAVGAHVAQLSPHTHYIPDAASAFDFLYIPPAFRGGACVADGRALHEFGDAFPCVGSLVRMLRPPRPGAV